MSTRNILRFAALVALTAALACSSGGAPKPDKDKEKGSGFRVLEAVVVERTQEHGSGGSMIYSMGFEARDGDANAHMSFEVTRDQYLRFQEGAHVKIYLADNRLRDIKSAE